MDHLETKPKQHKRTRDSSTRSQEDQHVEEKTSITDNAEDLEFASPTSAPPKLYSGSLFLYANDPFGCFTNETQGAKDDKQYNKFFDYSKNTKDSSHQHGSYSQGDIDNSRTKADNSYSHPIHETKSDLDMSDMMSSRPSTSIAEARLSPDRLDLATNKAIIDIFEDGYPDNKTYTQDAGHENKHQAATKSKEREYRGYVSPRKQKENRNFASPPMMVPQMGQMGYMQPTYMTMPNQPYVNMMPQPYAYPLNDAGFRRINSYPGMNYYPYESYPDRNQTPNSFGNNLSNQINNSNQKPKKEEIQKKDYGVPRKETGYTNQPMKQKEKRQDSGKDSDNNSLSGEQTGGNAPLEPEELENLIQNAAKLAKDQSGCRMLQKEIENEEPEVVSRIFDNIIQDFGQLMMDPFGNYLCQKLAEMCSNPQMKQIIQVISPDLAEICYNPHGTRAVQKLIEVVKEQSLIELLIESLARDVVGLIKDNNGNHVVQKCLTSMSDKNKQFIYDSIVQNCIDIATHKHGCCVIQRCLDHASKKQKGELTQVVAENALELVKDQYGNYVVQYVLELKDTEPKTRKRIADELTEDLVELSKQKFSSNVVEKCLQSGIPSFRNHFMALMMDDEKVVEIVCDKFGNYVLQRFLANAEEEERNQILQTISNNTDSIKNDPFGSKIYSKISKSYNFLSDSDSNQNPSLSPLISENSNPSKNTLRNDTNYRNNSENIKQPQRRQHFNRNTGDKRNTFTDNNKAPRRYSNPSQQNNMPKGPYRQQQQQQLPQQGPMMYPPMRNDMIPNPNFSPAMVQPGFYMPQPQMYNQYYSYPAPQQGMYYPKIY